MKVPLRLTLAVCAALGFASHSFGKSPDGKPVIVMIAGKQSHGPGEHEHNAGIKLLAKCLDESKLGVVTKVHANADWPSAEELAQADTIVIYSDGGGGHPAVQGNRLSQLDKEMKRGVGFVAIHYAVEVPKEKGGSEFREWLGGYFETHWSVNPHWTANFSALPKHPISNGVKPFSTRDEWYYHMRFRENMAGVTPILSDLPPEETLKRGDGPHSGNPHVRAAVLERKEKQHVAWAVERPDGGRGFGFTGGHFHRGWANDDQRKLMLNAILWTAKVDVPAEGVPSKVTEEDMQANLDEKGQRRQQGAAIPQGSPNAKPIASTKTVHADPQEIKADLKGAKELFLAVTDAGDGFDCDWAVWIEPTLIKADGAKIKLTELKPKFTKVGWGQFAVNAKPNGQKPIRVKGKEAAFGLGTHAPSMIAYDLPEGVVAFEAKGGVDEGGTNQGRGATVQFLVYKENPGEKVIAASPQPAETDRYGLEAAKANMSKFKTADGLAATLWAAEPMIQNPTNIDIDHRGRVWAVEAVNYRSTFKQWKILREEGDRVVILEDTDKDGLADKETVFWQGRELQAPLGICVLPQEKGTKVIVSAAPNVWLLTDADGDDKAEKADLLFKVGGNWDHDHEVHAFVFGPDGKFYFNFGNEGRKLMWPDGTTVVDLAGNEVSDKGRPYRQGMVFRCDIDLATGKASNVETLGHNFRNNYEVAVDSFGTMWQSDNDDDGNRGVRINYVMDYGNFGYTDELTGAGWQTKRTNIEDDVPKRHWHQNDPGVIPNLLLTGAGSPTGILINEGTALGPRFTNQMIHCDAGPRTVRAYPVTPDGAGFKAEMVDILTSSDSWYRPADVAIAPDGSLYVADWYDAGVGGHHMVDHQKGKIMGRIYRVASTGQTAPAPALDLSTPEGCVAALQSPNRATVFLAWQKLRSFGRKAEPALQQLYTKSDNPRMRARALHLLVRIPGLAGDYLRGLFTEEDRDLRVTGVRIARAMHLSGELDLEDFVTQAGKLRVLAESDPAVCREILLTLPLAPSHPEMALVWTAMASRYKAGDRWYLEALGIGARGKEDICFESWALAVGENWNTPANRDIIWRMRSPDAAGYLAKIVADKSIPDAEKPRYLRAFDFIPESRARTKALVEIATSENVAEEFAREALVRLKGVKDNSVAQALDKVVARAKGTPQFIELVRDFGVPNQGPAVLDTALKLSGDPIAADAVRLLLGDPQADQLINAALGTPKATPLIDLLGSTGTNRGLTRLTQLVTDANRSAELRQHAVRALARTQSGAGVLLKLAKDGKFPEDLKLTAATALAMVQYPALREDVLQHFPMPNALGGKPLPPISELVKMKGDVAKGKAITERVESSCVTCHRIGTVGSDFGPALSEIGTKLAKEAIYEAIINPNSGVSMGFETTQITLKDGGLAVGIVRSETNEEIVLALPAGASQKVRKSQIAKREKLPNSMMPSGLNQALTQEDLVNMVEYLSSLKKP